MVLLNLKLKHLSYRKTTRAMNGSKVGLITERRVNMTRNQILYQEHLEKARSNRAGEDLTRLRDEETKRSNLTSESLTARRDAETARSNQARETETSRSNLANELEKSRANRAQEAESHRSNVARETETNRSNLANELLKSREIHETATHNRNVETETNRSNLARELEAAAHNRATELEQSTHNRATEAQAATDNLFDYEAAIYSADKKYEGYQYSADASTLRQEGINQINLEIAKLKESGMNDRQANQIAAEAIKMLNDDIIKLVNNKSKSGGVNVFSVVKDIISKLTGGAK